MGRQLSSIYPTLYIYMQQFDFTSQNKTLSWFWGGSLVVVLCWVFYVIFLPFCVVYCYICRSSGLYIFISLLSKGVSAVLIFYVT